MKEYEAWSGVAIKPFKSQWSLYVPHSGHYMYQQV